MMPATKAQSGFTLVEVLIALTIFAVGLLAIATMQITAIKVNSTANTNTMRVALAQRALEEYLSKNPTASELKTAEADTMYDLDPKDALYDTLSLVGGGVCSAKKTIEPNTPIVNITRLTLKVTCGTKETQLVSHICTNRDRFGGND